MRFNETLLSKRNYNLGQNALLHFLGVRIADDDKGVNAPSHSLAVCREGVKFAVTVDQSRSQTSFRGNIVVKSQDVLSSSTFVPEKLRAKSHGKFLLEPVAYIG